MYNQTTFVSNSNPTDLRQSTPVDEPPGVYIMQNMDALITGDLQSPNEVSPLPRKIRRRNAVASETATAVASLAVAPVPSIRPAPSRPVTTPATSAPRKASRRRRISVNRAPARQCPHHYLATIAAAVTAARVSPTDLAWAAGFFDGEGSVGAYEAKHGPNPDGSPRRPSLRLVASIAQNRPEVLEEFLDVVGAHGKIYQVRRQACHNKQCYRLNFDGRHALELLYVLRPHLRRKKYEADAARDLAVQGRLGMYPGPKGFPPAVVKARKFYKRKIVRLK